MRKFLLLVVSLFIMTGAFADVSLDLTTATYGQWGDDDSYVINEDGTVTLTFVAGWTGTGWQSWGEPWDLTQYKSVVVEYTDLVGGEGNEDHPWIQLYIGSNPAIGQGDWGQSGRIEFVMADNVYVLDDDGNATETVYDYSSVGQIMIQSNGALSVTITAVTFVEEDTGDDDGDTDTDSDELPIDEDGDLGAGWSSSYDGATHTITYTGAWGGRGWWFGNPDGRDCSEYDGIEVVFKTDLTAYISLTAQYNYFEEDSTDGLTTTAGTNGSGASTEQTLYCELDPDMADNVMQIWIQCAEVGEIELVSARFVKNGGEEPEPEPNTDSDELPIDNDYDLSSGWSSSYDGATHTITYTGAWAGRGWWFGDPDTRDCSEYDGVEVVLKTDMTAYISLTVQYAYYEEDSTDPLTTTGAINGSGTGEEQTLYCELDPDMADKVIQIWIQSSEEGQIELVSARFVKNGGDEPEPEPVPAEGENLWDAVEDGSAYEGVYEYWATGDSWALIYEGTNTGDSGEYWSHDADTKTWTVTMPENAGSSMWQDQVHILTTLPVVGDTEYSFGCSILCDADGAATIKLVDSADDGDFFFDNNHTFVAGEVYNYVAEGVTMGDADSVKLVFDFAGTPGGAVITINNIAFNEGNELVATGIEEVAPAAAPVAKKGIYNLAGQRVNANAKGLLIIDGKKVLVK